MTHTRTPHRPARRLLLAAAMLPITPLAAQDATPSVEAPPVTITPPDAPAPSATPVQPALRNGVPVGGTPTAEPAPAEEAAATEEPAARPARSERRATQRAAERPRVRARASAPAPDPAPQPAAEPAPAVTEAPAVEAPVAPVAAAPATVAPEAAPAESAPPAEDRIGLAETWPLLAAGLLAVGGLFMLLQRRRRRRLEEAEMEQAAYDETRVYDEAPIAAEPAMAAAPLAHANDEHHDIASAPAAAAAAAGAANGRPWLELMMRPVRAGVGDEDARVEFELTVANQGSAPARDVRVSTFMLAGGSSDMEQSLIERPAEPQLAEPELDPGDGRRIESAVAIPRGGLTDSILPIVVADARYRLPDGSEGRTSARFAVGVPVDGDLAHFDVEHPSGLHEGVEARLEREPEQV